MTSSVQDLQQNFLNSINQIYSKDVNGKNQTSSLAQNYTSLQGTSLSDFLLTQATVACKLSLCLPLRIYK